MKDVKCPNCSNYGRAPNFDESLNQPLKFDDEDEPILENNDGFAFRQRGQIEGYPIWICNQCNIAGVWMKIGFWGKPEPITGEGFQGLKEDWERGTGTPF